MKRSKVTDYAALSLPNKCLNFWGKHKDQMVKR